jgi:hypothetical protein
VVAHSYLQPVVEHSYLLVEHLHLQPVVAHSCLQPVVEHLHLLPVVAHSYLQPVVEHLHQPPVVERWQHHRRHKPKGWSAPARCTKPEWPGLPES